MFYVYLIKNKDGECYIGCTGNLEKRIEEHNRGKVVSTQDMGSLELVYYEAYKNKDDAFHREKNLKLRANAFTGLRRRLVKSLSEAL